MTKSYIIIIIIIMIIIIIIIIILLFDENTIEKPIDRSNVRMAALYKTDIVTMLLNYPSVYLFIFVLFFKSFLFNIDNSVISAREG